MRETDTAGPCRDCRSDSFRVGLRIGPSWFGWLGRAALTAAASASWGKKIRVSLGNYPTVTLQSARARANQFADEAKWGVHPRDVLKDAATAGSSTVPDLSKNFLKQYVYSEDLDSARTRLRLARTSIRESATGSQNS